MKKTILLIVAILVLVSCGEKLVEPPEDLIPKDKMTDVLYDLAVLNAAKNTNASILKNNNIETMQYLYEKYGIDSVQFVKSDAYYASIPLEYQAIYKTVESRLEKKKKQMEDARKKINDSTRQKVIKPSDKKKDSI